MIHSVSGKYSISHGALSKVLWIVIALVMLKLPLIGQETIDYRGVWQFETPPKGRVILILKRNSLASHFWADNADRTVYPGTWSSDTNGAIMNWANGSSHRITLNLTGYQITHLDASQQTLYTTAIEKLPDEILGQWAKGPLGPEDERSDRDQARGFFGAWEIGDDSSPYHLVIEPDRSAATNWNPGGSDNSGMRGSWAKQGSELHIAWDTGYYGILKQNERNFTFRLIAPGAVIEENESNESVATRVNEDRLPAEWRVVYNDEKRAQTGGVAFINRKNAVSFYRGSWLVQRSKDAFERIEIGRFGGLKTSKDSTLYGNWRMSGQDIFMHWDNGMRKILSPVGSGFLLYEYKPGRPIDGVPTRIFSATPEDAGKLAKHMEGRKAVAMKLLSLAENAGVTSSVADAGWGQTFMRWAWPFGDKSKEDAPSNALLQADFDIPENIDPWWWPFWSENQLPEEGEPETVRNTVKIGVDSPPDEATVNETVSNKKVAKPKKSDWEWPF